MLDIGGTRGLRFSLLLDYTKPRDRTLNPSSWGGFHGHSLSRTCLVVREGKQGFPRAPRLLGFPEVLAGSKGLSPSSGEGLSAQGCVVAEPLGIGETSATFRTEGKPVC